MGKNFLAVRKKMGIPNHRKMSHPNVQEKHARTEGFQISS